MTKSISKGTEVRKIKKRIVPVHGLLGKITALIYGKSGTGKTTLASTIMDVDAVSHGDKVLLLDISEKGTDSVYDVKGIEVLEVNTWEDFVGAFYFLKDYEHSYKAVVIDTITQLQNLAMAKARERAEISEEGQMNRRAWGFLSTMLAPKLLEFRDLPMHVILIAQDRRDENDEDDGDDLLPEVGPAVMPSIARTVNAMVNVIGHTYIKQTEKQRRGKLVTITSNRLRLGPHPLYLTKVRSPRRMRVPSSIPNPTFKAIEEIIRGTYGKEEKNRR